MGDHGFGVKMEPRTGIEPVFEVYKTTVLPLNYQGIKWRSLSESNRFFRFTKPAHHHQWLRTKVAHDANLPVGSYWTGGSPTFGRSVRESGGSGRT